MAHDLRTRLQVPLSQPSISESDIEAVLSALRTPTLSIGPKVKAFEKGSRRLFRSPERCRRQ